MTTVLDIVATIRPSLVLPHSENVRPYQLLTRDQAASVVPGALNTFNVPRPLPVVEKITYPLLSRDQAATKAIIPPPVAPATAAAPTLPPVSVNLKEVNEISNSVSEVVVKAEVANKDSVVAPVVAPIPTPAPTPVAPAKASIMNFFTKKPSTVAEATISNGSAPRASEVKELVESTMEIARTVNELPPPLPSPAAELVPSARQDDDDDEDDTPLCELFAQPAVVKRAPLSADMAALLAEGDEEGDAAPSTTREKQPKAKKAPAEKKLSAKKPVAPLEPVVQAAVLSSINDEVVVTAFANPFLSAAPASVPTASMSNGVGVKRAREEVADSQTHSSLDGRSAEHSKTAIDVASKPTPAKKPSAAKALVNTATASASVLKAFCSPELAAFQKAYSNKTKSTVKLDPITNVYHCSEVTVYVENATGSEISSEEHRQLREDIMARQKISAADVAAVEPKPAVAAAAESTAVAKKAPAASAPAKMAKAPSTKKSRAEAASVGYKANPLACLFGSK